MAVPYLSLVDADSNTYNFPPAFWLGDDSLDFSQQVQNIAFAAGGKDISDAFPQARTIIVTGALRANSLAEFETAKRAFSKAILKGGKLYVSDDTVSRYLQVSNPQIKSSYIGDYRLEHPATVSFLVELPFWQDDTETSDVNIVTATDEFEIDVSDSDFIVFPVITIEADQATNIPLVKITNLSDGGMAFTYTDPNFVIGDTLIIDCIAGTVKRNGNDTIAFFSPAKFLRLQDVVNTIKYEGSAATVTFSYRKVYI